MEVGTSDMRWRGESLHRQYFRMDDRASYLFIAHSRQTTHSLNRRYDAGRLVIVDRTIFFRYRNEGACRKRKTRNGKNVSGIQK